jgi:hypothetical protein
MKLRWFNILALFVSVLCLLGTLFISSCESADAETACVLLTVKSSVKTDVIHSATQEYVYGDNKVQLIWVDNDIGGGKVSLEYNAEGMLAKVYSHNTGNPESSSTYEIIYDSNKKPQEVREWYTGEDQVAPPYSVVTFTHDGYGRLIKREVSVGYNVLLQEPERFEYNDDSNVTKIFYGTGANEYLRLENLSFDTASKYYGIKPELEILNVYILLNQPGKNNPVTARYYPGGNDPAVDLIYDVTYDESGRITSYHAPFFAYRSSYDFDKVTYICY